MNMHAGIVDVVTTENRGHDIEFHVERLLDRLIYVSKNAPEPIKAQALVYKDSMRAVLLDGMKRAIQSDRTTIAAILSKNGMPEAASAILKG
jgi:hypothetical protein